MLRRRYQRVTRHVGGLGPTMWGMTAPMHILDQVRAVVTAPTALLALLLSTFADDLDDVWEPFLDETYG